MDLRLMDYDAVSTGLDLVDKYEAARDDEHSDPEYLDRCVAGLKRHLLHAIATARKVAA